ncbi:hypothetical protein K439DRAFT_1509657 [Ramaria rubella]|nr:hypothetical protein K439DRAFT_1509657 [Ramaria rubella]
MFFSTELLSKRDSGYGLLWLAATLGSKSNLKKLPRRSVLTADILQLCTLISEPPEPLALRLSSNLMVGVVRVYKMKHEILESDINNCATSLKKNLNELHAIDRVNLEMAQPNGLRVDMLNLVVDPGMDIAAEFDGTIDDWDMVFRRIEEGRVLFRFFKWLLTYSVEEIPAEDYHAFPHPGHGDLSSEQWNNQNNKRLRHQLDESHDHLFSTSFLNSFSGEIAMDDPSSSANLNDVLFDLDFGDADIGLGEEMEKDLEEAWNMKVNREEEPTRVAPFDFAGNFPDANVGLGGLGGGLMDYIDEPLVPDIDLQPEREISEQLEDNELDKIDTSWLGGQPMHTPPPRDQAPARSILSHRNLEVDIQSQPVIQDRVGSLNELIANPSGVKHPKPRKRVTLVDPRTELTDEELKFQRDNYLKEMTRLRREAHKKKEQREGKRRFEQELWDPPRHFAAPELVELWNQRVTYPVKAREAEYKKEIEELQRLPKKRRIDEKKSCELDEENINHEPDVNAIQDDAGFDFVPNVIIDNTGEFDGDWGGMEASNEGPPDQGDFYSGGRPSSDDPGQARRAPSRPPSLPSSLLGRTAFNFSQGDPVSNSIFPWDNAGASSSGAALDGSIGLGGGNGSNLRLSVDNVYLRRGSKSGSARDSPAVRSQSALVDVEMGVEDAIDIQERSLEDSNPFETQESEGIITLERNLFNFLG